MPQRQSVITVDSQEIMGEGSWIKVRLVTHGQQKHISKEFGDIIGKDASEVSQARRADLQRINDELVIKAVVAWNWVDDDGQDLPLPKDDPSVVDILTEMEHQFIATAMRGEGERKK